MSVGVGTVKRMLASFAALAVVAGVTTLPADAATGRISGVAFEDVDRDGVLDAGEPVFSGHSIYLLTGDGSRWVGGAVTDVGGRYSFDGLEDGTYRVQYDSASWNPLQNDWFPTTLRIGSPPNQQVTVVGDASFDLGLRRIVRSTDVTAPVSEHVGSSGLRVQSYVDVVDARTIHDELATGMIGPEAPFTTVRFGLYPTSTTSTSSVESNGVYSSFSAVSHASYLSWAASGGSWTTLAHEYGHAWSHFHAAITQQTNDFAGYLAARGLADDPRVGSSYAWMDDEMIAEDYRQLLGPPSARTSPQANRDIPPAAEVVGLREYLADVFAVAPAGTGSIAALDGVAPSVTLVAPGSGSIVAGTIDVVAAAADDRTPATGLSLHVVVDGRQVGAAALGADGRYHLPFDTTTLTDGTHTFVVTALDAAGNVATSAPVSTTVQNAKRKGGGGGLKGGGRR